MKPRRRLSVCLTTHALHQLLHLREDLEIVEAQYDPQTALLEVFVQGDGLDPVGRGAQVRRVRLGELIKSEVAELL